MTTLKFNQSIDIWIGDIKSINNYQLNAKPNVDSWSIGQIVLHLIEATNFYFDQIRICISNDDSAQEEMSHEGRLMFQNNEFPDIKLVGPVTDIFMAKEKDRIVFCNNARISSFGLGKTPNGTKKKRAHFKPAF